VVNKSINKAVFLDRDGVLNATVSRDCTDSSPRLLSELRILEDVKESLDRLRSLGYLLIVVTNQPDISRGFMIQDDLMRINSYLAQELKLDDFYVCVHDAHHNCNCRKPKPGMLLAAASKYQISLNKSFMVGDRLVDVQAGVSAGCTSMLVSAERQSFIFEEREVSVYKNLKEVVDYICEQQ
jgi:D-glycero-D-manno-heptose 1,7-bisphosphate phosphatase